ncbi:MAG TPA: hypothetical protein VGG71_16255 [Chitinophagaceae bacterium]
MLNRSNIILTSLSGLLGTVALTLYFSAPFTWMPLPPSNATAIEILEFGRKYHTAILIDTWLQQLGTILSVVFALALVQIAGTSKKLAGRLTLLASTIITSLSLAEGTFALGALQAGDNGHLESALTCFDLSNVFVHIFLLAPSLFLMLGFSLRGTTILPKFFITTAITLGILFQFLGVVALFYNQFLLMVIGILMLQNLWTIAASIILLTRTKNHAA